MARNSRSVDTPSIKSNDPYERRRKKEKQSFKTSNSTHSLVETVNQSRDFYYSKNNTMNNNFPRSSRNKSKFVYEIIYIFPSHFSR